MKQGRVDGDGRPDVPELLAQSGRRQVWRTLLPLIPLLLVLVVLTGLGNAWTWGAGAALAAWSVNLLYRFATWRRCGDLWDDGVHLQVRRDGVVIDSVEWRELSGVHFWYQEWISPEWYFAYRISSLPRVTITRRGDRPNLDMGIRVPRFADLYLPTRSSRTKADQALQEACARHGITLRSPRSESVRKIDWSAVREADNSG